MTEAPAKDHWDRVIAHLGRRKLFRAAVMVLALLYGAAVCAPLLVNDRPYVIEAVDYREYRTALRTLHPIALSARDEFQAWARGAPGDDNLEDREAELQAAMTRVELLRSYLSSEEQTKPLDQFAWMVEELLFPPDTNRTPSDEWAAPVIAYAKELATTLAPRDPTRPGEGSVDLVPVTSHPLWESISAAEVLFLVLWLCLVTWPLWNRVVNRLLLRGDPVRIRRARRRKALAVLFVCVAASVAWKGTIDGERTFESSRYKTGLTEGWIVAERAVFPPWTFGHAETNTDEAFRPPTWAAATGFESVEARHGEPAADSLWRHPLGTDGVGRDVLGRLVWGARVSLSVGLLSAILLVIIGTSIGAVAGYFGGWVDFVLSRFLEVVLCFPAFFLVLMIVAFTDPTRVSPIVALVVVIALVRWTGVARLTRAEVLRLRELEFVHAARASGASAARTILRHVLPNALGPILVAGTFAVAAGILTESALSFLGFGVQPPTASWGSIINESRSAEHWWIQVFPGFLIFLTVVAYHLVGDAIRDAVDPRTEP